jgi:hypothetical protein
MTNRFLHNPCQSGEGVWHTFPEIHRTYYSFYYLKIRILIIVARPDRIPQVGKEDRNPAFKQ